MGHASILASPSATALVIDRSKTATGIAMPSTQIILTENIPGLGAEADVVKVRRGYARNFLLPHGKAFEVTKQSLRQLDNLKAKRAEREAAELNEAEELSRRIGKLESHLHARDRRNRQSVWFDHGEGPGETPEERAGQRDRSPSHRARAPDQDHRRTRDADQAAPRRHGEIYLSG